MCVSPLSKSCVPKVLSRGLAPEHRLLLLPPQLFHDLDISARAIKELRSGMGTKYCCEKDSFVMRKTTLPRHLWATIDYFLDIFSYLESSHFIGIKLIFNEISMKTSATIDTFNFIYMNNGTSRKRLPYQSLYNDTKPHTYPHLSK